uniref:AAA+ ATPase domain-containing protein n=1 Tax=viral metagenome TaxID=1070528 RepID=A0A6C0I8J6_9ZZZZ
MEMININDLLERQEEVSKMKDILTNFEQTKLNLTTKKGIYIYGDPGSGKTTFVINILKELDYDIVKYDAGDIRNKSIIDTITKHNMSDKNIMSMFHKKVKRIAIIMDEIDGMNNGDKGGINSLIKIIRPKRTKKQRLEDITMNPIICIGNYHMDKKIKELMKVCNVIELKTPTKVQMANIVNQVVPAIDNSIKPNIVNFIQGDLRKLTTIYELYKNKQDILNNNIIQNIFLMKSYNDDTRQIAKKLINNNYLLEDHLTIMNETDRTIVGLLYHENIIDVIGKHKKEDSIPFYMKILDNMCFADYIDRVTFQKQIWQFNEMSSLIKTFNNNRLYHKTYTNTNSNKQKYNPSEVRFTKVLTKYSTEYNNSIFIQNLCQQLGMDKKDMYAFFLNIKNKYPVGDIEITQLFENYEISKLDINRIYRYLEKYTKEDAAETEDIVLSDIELDE